MENSSIKLKEKINTIQNSHDEATALEMPTMTMNLPIIATVVTFGTLTALFGTVLGMIRSFAALAAGGGADSMQLSTGKMCIRDRYGASSVIPTNCHAG